MQQHVAVSHEAEWQGRLRDRRRQCRLLTRRGLDQVLQVHMLQRGGGLEQGAQALVGRDARIQQLAAREPSAHVLSHPLEHGIRDAISGK